MVWCARMHPLTWHRASRDRHKLDKSRDLVGHNMECFVLRNDDVGMLAAPKGGGSCLWQKGTRSNMFSTGEKGVAQF